MPQTAGSVTGARPGLKVRPGPGVESEVRPGPLGRLLSRCRSGHHARPGPAPPREFRTDRPPRAFPRRSLWIPVISLLSRGRFQSCSVSVCSVKGSPDPSSDQSQQEAKQREAEIRNTILAQVLDQAARARLSNLALVKPDKAKAVENYLIQMARFGQIPGKVTEQGLIEILEKVSQQTEKKTTVKFNRRKVLDSDEEDDY
ncbi:programmed cell death 5 [Columba livia]|uniref:Programmed cell death protein 5 n=3 Tax=Columbidae TaxID=8930 RepID=A0A2I0M7Y5_COLLI|nr:programmed cell death 5 [Columba livia]